MLKNSPHIKRQLLRAFDTLAGVFTLQVLAMAVIEDITSRYVIYSFIGLLTIVFISFGFPLIFGTKSSDKNEKAINR